MVDAIGAFNWRVNLNDTMWLKDFTHGQQLITSEQNSQEITYTLATPVAHGQLRQWFGEQLTSDEPNHSTHHNETERASMGHLIWLIVAIGFIYSTVFPIRWGFCIFDSDDSHWVNHLCDYVKSNASL